jgi:hypothetical protein
MSRCLVSSGRDRNAECGEVAVGSARIRPRSRRRQHEAAIYAEVEESEGGLERF